MEQELVKRGPGRPRSGPSEAAEQAFQSEKERIDGIYQSRKQSVSIDGYDFVPFYNRSKKVGFGKLVIRRKVSGGSVYQDLVISNVHRDEAAELTRLGPREAEMEHQKRKEKPRYGFTRFPKVIKKG